MLRINQIKLSVGHTPEQLEKKAAQQLRIPQEDIRSLRIVRRSMDARRKPALFYIYTLDIEVRGEEKLLRRFRGKENLVCHAPGTTYRFPEAGGVKQTHRTVIAGMGPAGLFCGYFLALHGYRPILLERGSCVEQRKKDVEHFWETGVLDTASNVQFGEGGAGTFSDGKLNTLVKDKDGRNAAVLETFVRFGAKENILYEAKPHIGTDVLADIVRRMREEIVRLGGEVRFKSCVTELLTDRNRVCGVVINGRETLPCEQLVLAVGHSARDTFSMLYQKGVPMEAKAFAVGLRVEHPQEMINLSQYGASRPEGLEAAAYKVTAKAENGRGVYSFCMCPGGYVVNASSEQGHTAVNGMSYSGRDGKNANSAVIVSVSPADFGSDHPLAGIEFQRMLERRAYEAGGGKIPAQRYGAFKAKVCGQTEPEESYAAKAAQKAFCCGENGTLEPQCRGAYVWADVSTILPRECNEAFVDGMESFGRQIQGFNRPDAVVLGVESRTSSPVRIVRNDRLQSETEGLYPCGEGAGYAGGITSAAMDGIRIAEKIAEEFAPFAD